MRLLRGTEISFMNLDVKKDPNESSEDITSIAKRKSEGMRANFNTLSIIWEKKPIYDRKHIKISVIAELLGTSDRKQESSFNLSF